MKVVKEAQGGQGVAATQEDLEQINQLSRKELAQEEVYTFSVRLCDNEVDRDGERFPAQTLEELAALFVGKSGIFDHDWKAGGQAARIYRTEVVQETQTQTAAGDGYCYLKGYAYMVRTEGNRDLIAEIDGGIKREVSVGCAVRRAVCSVCGGEMGVCPHQKGQEYDGQLCFSELREATDAFEFSFVAVPAQRNAGVMKRAGREAADLKRLVQGQPQCTRELELLEQEALLGRRYLAGLKAEVVRLGGLAQRELDLGVLKSITDRLEERELLELKRSYEQRAAERYPVKTQFHYEGEAPAGADQDGAFLI